MKYILLPIFSVILGALQLLIVHVLYLLVTLWELSLPSFELFVVSKHGCADNRWIDNVLGYMDGTYGILSWVLEYQDVFVVGRTRIGRRAVVAHKTNLVSVMIFVRNAFGEFPRKEKV